jgi:energy-coupling factor transporter ATP-binding protein EcfA2
VQRVSVVGCSGSGKSTVARRLSSILGAPYIELDALHWGPDLSAATNFARKSGRRRPLTAGSWTATIRARSAPSFGNEPTRLCGSTPPEADGDVALLFSDRAQVGDPRETVE